jgi:hypothetical protein
VTGRQASQQPVGSRAAQRHEVSASIRRLLDSAHPRRYAVGVTLAGCGVRFSSDLQGGIDVARTILGPYCAITDGTPPGGVGWTVISALVDDLPAAIERLEAQLSEAGLAASQIRRWAGDFAADRYDLAGGRCVIVHRRPFTGLDVFSRDDRELYYLRAEPGFDVPHTEHVIKYPLRVMLREAGFAQVHAAACRFRGKGLLYLGEKGRGKSTLLVQTMGRGARQVGNDMGYLRPAAGGGCEMIAFPHMTRVAEGTVSDSERLRTGLAREAKTGDYLRSPVFNGGKEEFYFPVLQRIWGADPVCRRTPVDLIVFPALDLTCTAAAATPVPAGQVRARLIESAINDPPLPDWLPFHTGEELHALVASAARQVAACAPAAVELRFGPSFTDPVSAIEDVLNGL